jgi:hypothetical protein
MMRKLLIPLAVLAGVVSLIGCSPSGKYSSEEAAEIVTQKMAAKQLSVEHQVLGTQDCSYLVGHYYSGQWIAEEKAHLLQFGYATSSGSIKYFESSDTILKVSGFKLFEDVSHCFG